MDYHHFRMLESDSEHGDEEVKRSPSKGVSSMDLSSIINLPIATKNTNANTTSEENNVPAGINSEMVQNLIGSI